MKVFVVFDAATPEEWGDRFAETTAVLRRVDGVDGYVIIDNDCSPELEPNLRSIAEALGGKVHRIERTPQWQIVRDVLAGQAAAGISEPTVVALGSDRRLLSPIHADGLLGPAGDVTESFVYTSDPVEFAATLRAKTREFGWGDAFAPAVYVAPGQGRPLITNVAPLQNLAVLFGADPGMVNRMGSLGLRPPDVHKSLVDFYQARLGKEATEFVVMLQTASQIADDFVDDEMPWPWRSRAMGELIETLLIDIPNHPFYKAHQRELEEIAAQCVATWEVSNGAAACDTTPESRLWAYIQREAFQMVVWRVAVIVGGRDHGRGVLVELQQMLHGPKGAAKSFPVWLDETRARMGRG